jgi:hypothetical protein
MKRSFIMRSERSCSAATISCFTRVEVAPFSLFGAIVALVATDLALKAWAVLRLPSVAEAGEDILFCELEGVVEDFGPFHTFAGSYKPFCSILRTLSLKCTKPEKSNLAVDGKEGPASPLLANNHNPDLSAKTRAPDSLHMPSMSCMGMHSVSCTREGSR